MGKFFLIIYRRKRRYFAGDKRVCHQPVNGDAPRDQMALSSVLAKVAKKQGR